MNLPAVIYPFEKKVIGFSMDEVLLKLSFSLIDGETHMLGISYTNGFYTAYWN